LNLQDHKENREKFYEKLPHYWADLYGQEYSLYDIKEIDKEFIEETKQFADKVGQLFFKAANLMRSTEINDDTYLQMGYPIETLSFLRQSSLSSPTLIGRFDSVVIKGTHKLLEFNADTPTFIYELFKVNGMMCKEFGFLDPNEKEETKLKAAINYVLKESYSLFKKSQFPNIVFTSHDDNLEDKNTVLYLKELCDFPSQYVPLDQLSIIKGEALLDQNGIPIDVLYRQTFPIESLILDKDPTTDAKIGEQLLELVALKKLAIINPPSAFLMQNKALMSVIWGLHEEESPFFSKEEHGWIDTYFLPTYLEPDLFIKQGVKYVKKPVFGREGDTVEIFDGDGKKIDEEQNKSYTNYLSIYQKYVDLPTTTFKTVTGEKLGHVMVGTFLINGKASSFGYRVGDKITNNLSYFLPIGLKK
jgi:glutathionylspermidine synthase